MAACWRNLSGTLFNLRNLSQASSGSLCRTLPKSSKTFLNSQNAWMLLKFFQAPRTPESLVETGFEPDFFWGMYEDLWTFFNVICNRLMSDWLLPDDNGCICGISKAAFWCPFVNALHVLEKKLTYHEVGPALGILLCNFPHLEPMDFEWKLTPCFRLSKICWLQKEIL